MAEKRHEYYGDGVGRWLRVFTRCACGWASKDRILLFRAKKDFAEHIQAVRNPPCGTSPSSSSVSQPLSG